MSSRQSKVSRRSPAAGRATARSKARPAKPGAARAEPGEPLAGFCPRFHRAVELIGRRWSGAIVRVLMRGPRRFNELMNTVPGLSDRLLSERLRELEAEGLVKREVGLGPPVCVTYHLTESGHSLEPVIESLGNWAERWMRA